MNFSLDKLGKFPADLLKKIRIKFPNLNKHQLVGLSIIIIVLMIMYIGLKDANRSQNFPDLVVAEYCDDSWTFPQGLEDENQSKPLEECLVVGVNSFERTIDGKSVAKSTELEIILKSHIIVSDAQKIFFSKSVLREIATWDQSAFDSTIYLGELKLYTNDLPGDFSNVQDYDPNNGSYLGLKVGQLPEELEIILQDIIERLVTLAEMGL
jgi:hypothetical protein